MTPIIWRVAGADDGPALSILGGATFLSSFAHDHPGAALVSHIRTAHGIPYYEAALADPEQTVLIGETPFGAPVGYAMITPPDLPIATDPACDRELKRLYLLSGWQAWRYDHGPGCAGSPAARGQPPATGRLSPK